MHVPNVVRLVAAGFLAVPAIALAGQGIAALGAITPGEWRLHEIGSRDPGSTICVRDAAELLQVRHAGATCKRFVVADSPRIATVHYTCARQGSGRTTITVEGDSLVRVQTQGIAAGAPFDLDYEARRQGACRQAGH